MINEILLQMLLQLNISNDDWTIVDEWIDWRANNTQLKEIR